MKNPCRSLVMVRLGLATIIFSPVCVFASAGPSIDMQPESQSVLADSNAVFTVGASGQGTLLFQWSFNGTNLTNSAHISGTTTNTLTINNVIADDAGNYQVVVSNSHGSVTSSNATLTVLIPATITGQPSSQSVVLDSNAIFAATASGTAPLSFRWYFNGTMLTDGGRVNGSATTNLSIANVQTSDSGFYQIVVTNNYGSVTSTIATLTVLVPPSIITQPTDRAVSFGGITTFSVKADGTRPLFYQWQKNGTDLVNASGINWATNDAMTITISNAQISDTGNYRVVLSNVCSVTVSTETKLVVVPVTVLGGNSYYNIHVLPLGLTNTINIKGGAYHSLALTSDGTVVSWGHDDYGQTDVPAGLGNVVAIGAGFNHSLALKNDGTVVGWGGTTNQGPGIIPTWATNVVALAGGNSYSLALKSDGTVFGWGYNTYGQLNIPYTLSNVVAIAAGDYHSLALKNDGTVVAWGDNGFGETNVPVGLSNVVAIAAGAWLSLALKSDGAVVGWGYNYYGQATPPAGLSNVVDISAGDTHSLALKSDGTIVGWGNNTYGQIDFPIGLSNKIVALGAGSGYSLALQKDPRTQVPPSIWWQPSTRISSAGKTTIFTPYVNGSLPLSFQWFFNGEPLAGETNKWLVLNSIQPEQTGNYQFVVTNNYGSVTGQVALFESPTIVTQPTNQTVFQGSNATFSVSAIGSAPLIYQWQVKPSASPCCWYALNATNNVLMIANVKASQSGNLYRVLVTNDYGSILSATSTLTVLTAPTFTQQPQSQTKALGSNVTFSATVSGAQPISFHWFFNDSLVTNGERFSISSGATGSSLTITGLQTNDAGGYFLVASNLVGMTNSSVANLTVVVPPSIVQQPVNQTAIVGSDTIFDVVADGSEPLAYQWRVNGFNLSDGGQISGAKTPSLTISDLTTPGTNGYSVVITNFAGSVTSAPATLIVYGVQITGQPLSRFVQLGSNTSFAVTAIGQAPLSYQWYFNGTPLSDGARLTGSATTTLSISDVQISDGGGYSVVVTNLWSGATSTTASLTVQPGDSNAVLYVDVNSTNPQSPYVDWSTAATNIQDAVDSAINGNLILVTNGVYNSGHDFYEYFYRVALTKAVTLLSVNGPKETAIVGDATTRGVYVGTNAVLGGFTITNGYRLGVLCESSSIVTNCVICNNGYYGSVGGGVCGGTLYNCMIAKNVGYSGAGAYRSRIFNSIISSNFTENSGYGYGAGAYQCILSNCVVAGNTALYSAHGGGTAGGTNYNCLISGNVASFGGGCYGSTNYNCLLVGNSAFHGGGVYGGAYYNCTIVNNSAYSTGGGAYQAGLFNSIIYFNSATNDPNWLNSQLVACCTTPSGYITADPVFVDQAGGNFRLQTNSPCIDAGYNGYVIGSKDLDGRPRIVSGKPFFPPVVDIGAYEFQTNAPGEFIGWLQQYDLPTDGSADYADTDNDRMKNWQEWIAGTDPINALSLLEMLSLASTNSPSGIVVSWQSVTNRIYFLQRDGDLSTQPPFSAIQSNIVGQAGTTTYTDTSATNGGPYFYRVGVQVQ